MPNGDINYELISDVLDGDTLLTTREAARILGLKPETLIRRKDIPRLGPGQPRWRSSVIDAIKAAGEGRRDGRH